MRSRSLLHPRHPSPLSTIAHAQDKPWPIRAVIITTFEIRQRHRRATPGEFQFWVDTRTPRPDHRLPRTAPTRLRTNADHTILGMVSGVPPSCNATASMMAVLGLDPRFDLTRMPTSPHQRGIAGVQIPLDASVGSAAWAIFVVGDTVSRYIDPYEAPANWPYGFFPIGWHCAQPAAKPPPHPWMRSNTLRAECKTRRLGRLRAELAT